MSNCKRYLMTICYDGSQFDGFQRLKKNRSVQKELENTLKKILLHKVYIKGAGRTDKGVHALNQKCHFETEVDIPIEKLRYAINNQIDKYIYVKDITLVDRDFHARFNVTSKTYRYLINYRDREPLKENYYYQYKYDFNIELIKEASKYLLGTHDFKNFVSGYRKNYVTTINCIYVEEREGTIIIELNGTAFYQYMVRNIVGMLLLIGREDKDIDYLKNMIDNPNIRAYCPTISANGLYLVDVFYEK